VVRAAGVDGPSFLFRISTRDIAARSSWAIVLSPFQGSDLVACSTDGDDPVLVVAIQFDKLDTRLARNQAQMPTLVIFIAV